MELQVGVKIAIIREGKVLLLKRAKGQYRDIKVDRWDIVGGRIRVGTDLLTNLKREVMEETKLEVIGAPKLLAAQDILKSSDKHVVRLTYQGQASGDVALDHEHEEYKWMTYQELMGLGENLDVYFKRAASKQNNPNLMPKEIIAHRGAPKLAPENTLQSFERAITLKASAIELDVRKTNDGVLAVFHDGRISGRRVSHISFEKLTALASKKGFKVPDLAEALKEMAGKTFVYIELKEQGFEAEAVKVATETLGIKNFTIISFKAKSLKKIKQLWPKISVGMILKGKNAKAASDKDFDFFAIHYKLWKKGFAKTIPKNKKITVWTADDPKLIQALFNDKRIYGVTTNDLELALKLNKKV